MKTRYLIQACFFQANRTNKEHYQHQLGAIYPADDSSKGLESPFKNTKPLI